MNPVLAILLFPIAAAQDVETPKTVNGQELGTAEEFQNRGPGRICLENAAFDMVAGESATLQYAGIHSAALVVTSTDGSLLLRHGDSWAERDKRRRVIWQEGKQEIRRAGRGRGVRYLYFAPTDYSEGEPVLSVIVSGKALKGDDRDLPSLRRLTLHEKSPDGCMRHYRYGWDMLFGDEPLSTGKKE